MGAPPPNHREILSPLRFAPRSSFMLTVGTVVSVRR